MDALNVNTTIFKSYDVRGKVGDELNPAVTEAIGKAFADWLPRTGAVAVGRDMRPDSAELAASLIAGLLTQGRVVIDIGEVTTDMIYFAVGHFNLAGGAMVTASHNPGEYNGIKLCREEARPIGLESGLAEIRDSVAEAKFNSSAAIRGQIETRDITEDWISHTLSFVDETKLTPFKIAVDAGNGMAGKIFPELEPYVPWEISELYFELDGTFPNHEANPLKFETLQDIIVRIKTEGLDGGIAFDGDGDRAFLIDETGEVLTGGVMSAMLADYFLELEPGASIIYDARNSRSVPRTIQQAGGNAVMTKVGHANIKQVMREQNAPFGGEASGHFYFRDNWFADSGLIGAVIGLYVAGLRGKKLSELRQRYSHFASLPETNFTIQEKDAVLSRIRNAFPDAQQSTLDGLTLDFGDDMWLNVRASNTEPLLRLNAEAPSQETLHQLVTKVTRIITES